MFKAIALAVSMSVCGACGASAAPDDPVAAARVLDAQARRLPCTMSASEQDAVVAGVDRVVRDLDHRPSSALAQARGLFAHLDAPAVEVAISGIGDTRLLVQIDLGCPSSDVPGPDTWLAIYDRRGTRWHARARTHLADPARHQVIAIGARNTRVAVLSAYDGTQASVGTLRIYDRDLRVREQTTDLIDPTATEHGPVAVLRWSRRMRHFGARQGSPLLIEEEAVIDVDREPMVLRAPSPAPWRDALDAACDGPPGATPCGGELVADVVVGDARELHIAGLPHPLGCAVVRDAPPPSLVDDRAAVVTMRFADDAWRVDAVRPEDRQCAVHGARLHPSAAPAARGAVVARLSRPRALATAAGGDVLIATANALHVLRAGTMTFVAEVEEPVDVAATSGGPIVTEAARGIRATLATAAGPIVEDLDAVALAACDATICWSAYDAGEIRRLRHGKVVRVANGLRHPLGLTATATGLVVATDDGLVAVTLADGTTTPIATAVAPIDVAVDGDRMAWTEATGRLVVQIGDHVHVIAAGGRPSAVALSGDSVYWIDVDDGTVRQAALPR